ncbi:MGDG synthase family glycosyltransferase [Desulfothermobacter acidiphilus]|uniref:MGDG synthase family glycosyltransferase n=1 Tax=Desulfothermobacter acidiphilus TaxID=1938353 RepID=UPI003F89D13C
MARLVFLTAEYGAGHTSAARALLRAVQQLYPSWEGRLINFVHEINPWFDRFSQRFYLSLICRAPSWYGWLYHLTDAPCEKRYLWDRWGSKTLARLCRRFNPQMLVATFPTPGRIAGEMRLRGELSIPVVMVITDHTAHSEWAHPGVDLYLVADEQVAERLEQRGVQRHRIAVTGIPIDPAFTSLPSRQQAKRFFGLPLELPVVLLSGGGYSRTAFLERLCEELVHPPFPLQAVVVAGKDEEWRSKLQKRYGNLSHFLLLGFEERMDWLMRAVDCLVGKAGALTLAEAAAAELPVIVYRALPGQEEANLRYYCQAGSAWQLPSSSALRSFLCQLFHDGKSEAMRAAARRVARPEAALLGAELLARQLQSSCRVCVG